MSRLKFNLCLIFVCIVHFLVYIGFVWFVNTYAADKPTLLRTAAYRDLKAYYVHSLQTAGIIPMQLHKQTVVLYKIRKSPKCENIALWLKICSQSK